MDPSRQERNAYQYSNNNPVNYTDPSGLITQQEAPEAKEIRDYLLVGFEVEIVRDWGYRYAVWFSTEFLDQAIPNDNSCSQVWENGHWTIEELRTVRNAIRDDISIAMGGSRPFKDAMGDLSITRVPLNIGAATITDRMWLGDRVFYSGGLFAESQAKEVVAHELAHVWSWEHPDVVERFKNAVGFARCVGRPDLEEAYYWWGIHFTFRTSF